MLQQTNFYFIKKFSSPENGKVVAEIELNPQHGIFKGHFPGSPVVPGVCMVQMTKEMLEKSLNAFTGMIQSSQVKFLAIVNPDETKYLQFNMEIKQQEDLISVSSTIVSGEKVFFKFKGLFKINE